MGLSGSFGSEKIKLKSLLNWSFKDFSELDCMVAQGGPGQAFHQGKGGKLGFSLSLALR